MKRQILSGLAGLALVSVALGRTDSSYVNSSILICPPSVPPQIDATNFLNTLAFIDNTYNFFASAPFETANTVTFSNLNVMASLTGFRFDTYLSDANLYTNAAIFYNEKGAIINCGGTNYGRYFSTNATFFSTFFGLGGETECLVSATNIINRGTIDMGVDSLLSLSGENVLLSGGLLNMEGFETGDIFGNFFISGTFITSGGFFGTPGWFDGYWGVGTTPQKFNPATDFGFGYPSSPSYWVTNRDYTDMLTSTYLFSPTAYQNPSIAQGPTNNLYQVVFLQNADPSVSNNVYFLGDSIVEWVWSNTNMVTGLAQTNHMFLEDSITSLPTLGLIPNGTGPASTGYATTFIPTNYFFFQGDFGFFGNPALPGLFSVIGPNTNIFAEYSAYEALFQPTTAIASDVANQTYSNMPGRIEITANKQLDLSKSRIAGLNYVRLTAPHNFTNDANTRILTAVADYDLGVTNATLVVTNLMAPTCPRLNGYVDVFSTRWTNVETVVSATATNTVVNRYYITMVDSHLTSTAPTALQNLTLHAPTNVVISDVLNVISSITIDTENITITTNGPRAQAPAGQLNFPVDEVLGTNAFPRLRTLTNNGVISVQGTATFEGATNGTETSLAAFVNHGSVLTMKCTIWSSYFENTGLVDSGPGPISLSANSAVLRGGTFNAPLNDITLASGSLFISNQVLTAGLGLTLQVADSLKDGVTPGGSDSGNVWSAGLFGFSLASKPAIASLLGTTITDTAPDWAEVTCQWAGSDLGPVAAGYSNTNAPLGRLILDGGLNSSFVLTGPTGNHALYVDTLELRNSIAAFDDNNDLPNLQIAAGMKIYYAQLIVDGISYAEKLDHKNGGSLNWVPAYAGVFSSTNLVYGGTTNRLNLALVQSCDIDSNCDGTPNCTDPAPVLLPSQVALAAGFAGRTNVVLSWNGVPFRTNYLEFKPSLTATNWQPLTNFFVPGPECAPLQSVDSVTNTVPDRFYRVRVDAAVP